MHNLIIVGDKFTHFSQHRQNVITISELEFMVWQDDLAKVNHILLGQGVELARIASIISTIKQTYPDKINQFTNLALLSDQKNKAHQEAVHKQKQENILITSPTKQSDQLFNAHLMIQDSSELMLDHTTGQHIQGMVLIEAARQMLIAVTELYLMPEAKDMHKYVILSNINVAFKQFIFPMPIQMAMSLSASESRSPERIKISCAVAFIQDDLVKSTVSVDYQVHDANKISLKENELAEQSFQYYLQ